MTTSTNKARGCPLIRFFLLSQCVFELYNKLVLCIERYAPLPILVFNTKSNCRVTVSMTSFSSSNWRRSRTDPKLVTRFNCRSYVETWKAPIATVYGTNEEICPPQIHPSAGCFASSSILVWSQSTRSRSMRPLSGDSSSSGRVQPTLSATTKLLHLGIIWPCQLSQLPV